MTTTKTPQLLFETKENCLEAATMASSGEYGKEHYKKIMMKVVETWVTNSFGSVDELASAIGRSPKTLKTDYVTVLRKEGKILDGKKRTRRKEPKPLPLLLGPAEPPTPEPTSESSQEPTPPPHNPQPRRLSLMFRPVVTSQNRGDSGLCSTKIEKTTKGLFKRHKEIFKNHLEQLQGAVELHNLLVNHCDYLTNVRARNGDLHALNMATTVRRVSGCLQGTDFFADACVAMNLPKDAGLDEMLQAIEQLGKQLAADAHHMRGYSGFIPTVR